MNDPHDNTLDDKAALAALVAKYDGAEEFSPAEEDLSDEALALPPPEPPPLAPGETATLIGTSVLGDTYDAETGEVLKDAPGWDPDTKRITNNEGCNFFGALLRETLEAMAENERLAAPEIATLERKLEVARLRLARAQKPLESRSAWLEGTIRAYADAHKSEVLRGLRKDAKSRRFPSGLRLAWKSGGGEYRWRKDMPVKEREAALLAWAKATADRVAVDLPPMVESMERPILANVKVTLAALADPEEPRFTPPGLEYVPEHEELTVKVEGDK